MQPRKQHMNLFGDVPSECIPDDTFYSTWYLAQDNSTMTFPTATNQYNYGLPIAPIAPTGQIVRGSVGRIYRMFRQISFFVFSVLLTIAASALNSLPLCPHFLSCNQSINQSINQSTGNQVSTTGICRSNLANAPAFS
jgi:hypothetical protein